MRSRDLAFTFLITVSCWITSGTPVLAQSSGLEVGAARAGQIRVDGDLGEWRGLRARVIGDDPTSAVDLRLAFDATGLFIGASCHDDTLVRSAEPSLREDALIVDLALSDGQRTRASEVRLYAGEMGRSRARITVGSDELSAPASIVEGPLEDGYVIEAFVPWAKLAGGSNFRFARGRVRLHDVDRVGSAARDVSSSTETDPQRWPWLLLDAGPVVQVSSLLRDKNLTSTTPKLDRLADVRGDASVERVLVVGSYVVRSDAEGGFTFTDLPVTHAADVRSAELSDLTGDGKPELVLGLRQENDLGVREILQVIELGAAQPRVALAIETRKQTRVGVLDTQTVVERARKGDGMQIRTRAGKAQGLSPDNYEEAPSASEVAILLPWGPVSERVYAWDGTRFSVVAETANPHAMVAPTMAVQTPTASSSSASTGVVHDEPPGTDALVAAYREARGVPADAKPRFEQHCNLAEDKRVESMMLFGAELVVVGDGFQDGVGFFYFGLPVRDGKDVLRIFTGDVTGDGRREVFVRVRQIIGEVQREILLGYTFAGGSLSPILQVEVRRARAMDSVGNVVALVRSGKAFALEIAPGFAHGWSERDYPYVRDSGDGIGPLLLPWSDEKARYVFDGRALVPGARP